VRCQHLQDLLVLQGTTKSKRKKSQELFQYLLIKFPNDICQFFSLYFLGDYGTVALVHTASLLSPKVKSLLATTSEAVYPQTFEALENYYGYVLYETPVPATIKKSAMLAVDAVNDIGTILLNDTRVGLLRREDKTLKKQLTIGENSKLGILVENLGRINYGALMNDTKGIENVTLDNNLLTNWKMTKFPFDSVNKIVVCDLDCKYGQGLRFYVGEFILSGNFSEDAIIEDSFIDVSGLKKGLVFINDYNLGRYWSTRGPQYSLYVPGVWLNKPPLENVMVVFEEYINLNSLSVKFSKVPIWSKRKSS